MAQANDTKPRPRRGPAWAYMVGGAIVVPFLDGLVTGRYRPDLSISLIIIGVALGWFAYRIFSQPKQPHRPPDYRPPDYMA
jgi:hypothetical protein